MVCRSPLQHVCLQPTHNRSAFTSFILFMQIVDRAERCGKLFQKITSIWTTATKIEWLKNVPSVWRPSTLKTPRHFIAATRSIQTVCRVHSWMIMTSARSAARRYRRRLYCRQDRVSSCACLWVAQSSSPSWPYGLSWSQPSWNLVSLSSLPNYFLKNTCEK